MMLRIEPFTVPPVAVVRNGKRLAAVGEPEVVAGMWTATYGHEDTETTSDCPLVAAAWALEKAAAKGG